VGGGSKMATQAMPPPPPAGGITPKISGIAASHHVAGATGDAKCQRVVRKVSASGPPRSHVASVVRGEKTRLLQILFN
jgi:hypothetical protein